MKSISKFQYITHTVDGLTHQQMAELACKGGAEWIQLRVKDKSYEEWVEIAKDTREICNRYNAVLIINDNVSLAREVKADGVHLGKEDMHPEKARSILGDSYIIGATANTFDDIVSLERAGVNYIGLGPFRFTETKSKLGPILGIEGYRSIISEMGKTGITTPVIAIGGITVEDIPEIIGEGLFGIAVSSSLGYDLNIEANTAGFLKSFFDHSNQFQKQMRQVNASR